MSEKVHWTDIALALIGAVLAFFSLRWLKNVFASSDGKKGFSYQDLLKLAAFVLFTWAAVFIIVAESKRTDLSHQVYGSDYLFLIFGSLFFVLGMDTVLDKILEVISKLIELRKAKPKSDDDNPLR